MDFWLKFERMDGIWFSIGEWVKKTVHREEGSEQLFRKNIKNRKKYSIQSAGKRKRNENDYNDLEEWIIVSMAS